MFFNSKLSLFVLILSVYVGVKVSNMYVPKGFESPLKFRATTLIMEFSRRLSASIGKTLRIQNEPVVFRNLVNAFNVFYIFNTHRDVDIERTQVNNVKVKIYRPKVFNPTQQYPAMIYYHGGAYTFGHLDSYDMYLSEFVSNLGMIVISVDYRTTPEHPYPIPTKDCYTVAKHVLTNSNQYKIDDKRVVLAGDSAGGDAVAVVTQLLNRRRNISQPKIQVLTYPSVQKATMWLPSQKRYLITNVISNKDGKVFPKYLAWYLGITNFTHEIQRVFERNEVLALIDDKHQQRKILSYFDVKKIPNIYKREKSYYQTWNRFIKPPEELFLSSVLRKDQALMEAFKLLTEPTLSPLFAHHSHLKNLPKAYFIILEWDALKDEGLLYAERLKEAGIDVEVAFYENAFHGIVNMIQPFVGYQIARDMQSHLIEYLQTNL